MAERPKDFELLLRELASERQRLAGIIDSATDAIITVDKHQRIQVFNRAAEQIFRMPAPQAIGLPLDRFIPPRFRDIHRRHVQHFGETGVTNRTMYSPGELVGLRADGEEFPIEATISQVEAEGEKLYTVILRDVSERQRILKELDSERQRLSGIINSAMDAIITVDTSQRILVFNHAAEQIFRVSSFHAIGQPLDRFIPQRFRDAHRQHIEHFGHTGVTNRTMYSPGELTGLRADGEEFPIEATISQVEADGQRLYTVILRDITERRRSEEALRASEKLAATGRLAATIAHEINNPLESVTNLLYLMEQQTRDPELREYAALAQQELSRVVNIAKQTLGFYRESTSPVGVRPGDILDSVLELYSRKLQQRNAIIERRYEFQGEVRAFPGEIRQVFSNLITNAADALPDGGCLRLHVFRSRDWRDSRRAGVRVVVADNGHGIPPEHRRRIFEPFFTTKGEKGTGLGLWVSHGIVHKHGGSMRARSSTRPGRSGAVFSVFLPDEPAGATLAPFHRPAA